MKRVAVLIVLAVFLVSGCEMSWSLIDEPTQDGSSLSDSTKVTLVTTPETVTEMTTARETTAKGTSASETTAKGTTSSGTTAKATTTTGTTTRETTAKATTTRESTAKVTTTTEPPIVVNSETVYSITLKRDVLTMMLAYPTFVSGVEKKAGYVYLVMSSGKRILYDDKKSKTYDEKQYNADIQDMLKLIYPLTSISSIMGTNFDPGRFRVYALLNDIYGSSKTSVSSKLISVKFGSQSLSFNRNAGAAAALKLAAGQAAALVKIKPTVANFLYPSSGTFNYRVIAGTTLLSTHAYGIAIDLKSNSNDYWLWATQAAGTTRIKAYPKDLVKIFENNGFIWGGKWNHFDIMHYEYRPEIIIKARYFPGKPDLAKPWYQGANLQDVRVPKFIAIINNGLK